MDDKVKRLKNLYKKSPETEMCRKIKISHGHKFVCDLGYGNPDAKIFFIGEAPGKSEDLKGIPFIGDAGKKFRNNLEYIGLSRKDVWVGNVVRYRPTTKGGKRNRAPKIAEIKACLPLLLKEIEIIDPDIVVPMGLVALKALTGKTNNMKASAGRAMTYGQRTMFPLYHPASEIYNKELRDVIRKHFEELGKLIHKGEIQTGIDKFLVPK